MKLIHTIGYIVILQCILLTSYAQDIIINEINYRNVNSSDIKFIELYNRGNSSVDLSNWQFTGGIDYTIASGTFLSANAYLVFAQNPAQCQYYFGISNVKGPILGKISGSGDKIKLQDAECNLIDEVQYEPWKEWPNVRYANDGTTAISIQLQSPNFPNHRPGSWSAAYPTPMASNSEVLISNVNSFNTAIIKDVSKSPDKPVSGEQVRIKASFSTASGTIALPTQVTLQYQINLPAYYKLRSEIVGNSTHWISMAMVDDGTGPDSTANNGVFTAEIPGSVQNHRSMIRYRIKVTSATGAQRYYPDPNHTEMNYAYYVYDGYPAVNGYDINQLNHLQDFTVITSPFISNFYIGNIDGNNSTINQYQGYDYLGEGTLVYEGKVYDHIRFRPRGKTSRVSRRKPGIKFDLNNERGLVLESDCGKNYDEPRDKLVFSGTWVNDIASHGLTESIIYKLNELVGGLPRYTDYTQLRIVDSPVENGNSGDFWGIYLVMEDYEGDYLKEHDFAEGNFWGTNPTTRYREIDYIGDFPNAASYPTFAPSTQTYGEFTINSNGNLPLLFGDRIANEMYGLNGNNYIGKHSYREYYDSATQKYLGWWGDMDNSFGSPFDDVVTFPRSESDVYTWNNNQMLIPSHYNVEYMNTFRSAYDLLFSYLDPACNCYQTDYLVDQESKAIWDPAAPFSWVTVDRSRWNQTYDLGNYNAHQAWYKSWFANRKNHLLTQFSDVNIPYKPSIWLTGSNALDEMVFSNSAFSDPNGNGTVAAIEWRAGEWSDPSNPYYDQECEAKYEIETKWSSGEIPFSTSFSIPTEAKLKADRTYLIRVRYKDTSGRWSHWSNPVKIVPSPAVNPVQYDLVINEIMYNPQKPFNAEFIELYNTGNQDIDLTNIRFNEGIDYEFPAGAIIPAGSYLCLAEDSDDFYKSYGSLPYGEYSGQLDDAGELLRLIGSYRAIIDTVRYNDSNPWPGTPDKGLYSLALQSPGLDNGLGANWSIQSVFTTPCTENNFSNFGEHAFSGIVINEIHYNPLPKVDPISGDTLERSKKYEFIELKNITQADISLDSVLFSRGIEYAFPSGDVIAAGDFLVLADDKSSFEERYGFAPYDKYDGQLNNDGESIWLERLTDQGSDLLDVVTYDNDFPWDTEADGGLNDYSLALIDPSVNNNTWLNWQVQCTALWTPGSENDFSCFNGYNYDGLVINEIHYSPTQGDNFEYIELVNNSSVLINLDQLQLTDAVDYVFENQLLAPNNFVVIASDVTAFQSTYGFAPVGEYIGNLDDVNATIKLKDLFGNTVDEVSYNSIAPWPVEPSQGTRSLVLRDASLDNMDPQNWCSEASNVSPNIDNECTCDYTVGTPCNDGNPCTIGEAYDNNCECTGGQLTDSDGDGVCDLNDSCPNFNDNLIGTACDDGDACTVGETYDSNCQCSGGVATDSDNDGVCNVLDVCANIDDALIGQPCEDGDPCTTGETYDNSCNCTGGITQDTDGDGVCDALDNNCVLVDFEDFESGQGIWQTNGIDAFYATSALSPDGDRSFAIRDNSGIFSSMSSSIQNLSAADYVDLSFMFHAFGYSGAESFYLEVSVDGGSSFTKMKEWFVNTDFNLGQVYAEQIELQSGQFSATTVFRFTSDGTVNSDIVYLDNIIIDACPQGCEPTLIEANKPAIVQSASVEQYIQTNGRVNSGNIEYQAGDHILMNGGFEVRQGAVFHAFIAPCQ